MTVSSAITYLGIDAAFPRCSVSSQEASPIEEAILSGNRSEAAKILDETPRLVNAKGIDGDYLMSLISKAKDKEMFRLFIDKGARKNLAFSCACNYEFDEIIDYLIKDGIDINSPDDTTWLMSFAQAGSIAGIRALLIRGANPNIKNKDGFTALDMARWTDQEEICKLLKQSMR
jgi:ankyrin repeat protein